MRSPRATAVASGLGIEPRHHHQRPDLDAVATPHHRQRLEFAHGVRGGDFVVLLPQRDLEQLAFRRRRAIFGINGDPVFGERILVVAERFGEPAAQHRDRRLVFRRNADDFQIAAALGGAGIILDLKGCPHRLRDHDALQLDRQRGDGEFDVLEFLPGLGPLTQAGGGQRLP